MPLRVPELAPSLGRLIVPRRQREPWVPIDDVREALATAVLELGGRGRAAAQRGGRQQRKAVGHHGAHQFVVDTLVGPVAEDARSGLGVQDPEAPLGQDQDPLRLNHRPPRPLRHRPAPPRPLHQVSGGPRWRRIARTSAATGHHEATPSRSTGRCPGR